MVVWDDLQTVIARFAAERPRPLTRWPDPRTAGGEPPFEIGLAAWATDVAGQLYRQFGEDVELTVGALRYPQRSLSSEWLPPRDAPARQLDSSEAAVAVDGPLSVRSGHSTHHGLLISNCASHPFRVDTSGELIADVVDPGTGAIVGGHSGPVFAMLKIFDAAPGTTVRIPLLVGTDSFVPDLGYAVPPGTWGIQVTLAPAAGHPGRSPVFPLTITS
jgi:hypothetical protein